MRSFGRRTECTGINSCGEENRESSLRPKTSKAMAPVAGRMLTNFCGLRKVQKELFLTHEDELRSVILGDCNAGWQLCLRFEFKQNLVPDEFWYAQHQV